MNAQNVTRLPGILGRMSLSPEKVNIEIPPQEYLDGLAIPRNNMTFLFTDGGSGKSTGSRKAGIEAAATGRFSFLGERYHDRPLRVVLIYGEETEENIVHSIQAIPGCRENFRIASEAGRICIVSMIDYQSTLQRPERVFGADGSITEFGREMFDAIHDFRPDLVVIDTLTSLSDTEYLDGISSRNAVQFLNGFCARARCAGMAFGHLAKGAGSKLKDDVTPAELLSIARGSAMLPNSSRHFIVMVPAPKGMYSARMTDDPEDEVWIGTVKTNLQGCPLAFKIFPAIRDASEKTLSAVVEPGTTLADRVEADDEAIVADLEDHLYCLIKLAAESLQPFAESGKMSPASLYADLLAPALPAGATKRQVERAIENLIRRELVKVARLTATGMPLLDVEGGPFADPDANLDPTTGKPPQFKKGAPDVGRLAERLGEELEQLRAGRGRKNQDRPF